MSKTYRYKALLSYSHQDKRLKTGCMLPWRLNRAGFYFETKTGAYT